MTFFIRHKCPYFSAKFSYLPKKTPDPFIFLSSLDLNPFKFSSSSQNHFFIALNPCNLSPLQALQASNQFHWLRCSSHRLQAPRGLNPSVELPLLSTIATQVPFLLC